MTPIIIIAAAYCTLAVIASAVILVKANAERKEAFKIHSDTLAALDVLEQRDGGELAKRVEDATEEALAKLEQTLTGTDRLRDLRVSGAIEIDPDSDLARMLLDLIEKTPCQCPNCEEDRRIAAAAEAVDGE